MAQWKNVVAGVAAVLAVGVYTVSAEAHFRRYGYDRYAYDRYGYHAPRVDRWYGGNRGWDYYPAYATYPAYGYYEAPRYRYYVPPYVEVMPAERCWYDYGWYRLRRVCY